MKSFIQSIPSASHQARHNRSGFTLLQIVIVLAILALLASILIGTLGRSRSMAQRIECDAHLKEIAMALDTFRQENGQYPLHLSELVSKNYLPAAALRCPSDPDANSTGYDDFYVLREAHDSDELPVLVCPFHEDNGAHGAQAFKGRYTQQFLTQPAVLVSAVGASVVRPGKGSLAATTGMPLHGGDRIVTGAAGAAVVRFADNSTSTMAMNCDVTIMQSYVDGQSGSSLYTLVRQNVPATIGGGTNANVVNYKVTHGSSFDVATPTATAGALGTEYNIKVTSDTDAGMLLTVIDSTVALTEDSHTTIITEQIYNDKTTKPDGVSVVPGDSPSTSGGKKTRDPRKAKKSKDHGAGVDKSDDDDSHD